MQDNIIVKAVSTSDTKCVEPHDYLSMCLPTFEPPHIGFWKQNPLVGQVKSWCPSHMTRSTCDTTCHKDNNGTHIINLTILNTGCYQRHDPSQQLKNFWNANKCPKMSADCSPNVSTRLQSTTDVAQPKRHLSSKEYKEGKKLL